MRSRFDGAAEQELREAFIAARGGSSAYVYQARSCIRRSCLAFREAFPEQSILDYTHTTEWVGAWNAVQTACAEGMRRNRLATVGAWWQWLFERRVIDDNVLEVISPRCQLARDGTPRITLRRNLQRHIVEYLGSRTDLSARTREIYGCWLKRFNVFINQSAEIVGNGATKLAIDEKVLGAWFRFVCAGNPRGKVLHVAGTLTTFLDFLVSRGVVADNTLRRLHEAYPGSWRVSVAYALAAEDPTAALRALAQPPRFRSDLAEHVTSFLEFKQAAGCGESYGLSILRDFDRFLVAHGEQGPITNALLVRWWGSRTDLGPEARRHRWIIIRQFCLYLRRYIPETCVPDALLGRVPASPFRPRIVQPEEMKALLAAVATIVPGSRSALRPHTYRTLLVLLYSTGLRISEALELQVGDVDLCERVITIRQTKFYKSRLVPFSDGLLEFLCDYQRERLRLLGPPSQDAPFFPTMHGDRYSRGSVNDVWQELVDHAGLREGAARGPRVHDLRHSFATLRLAAWYREGADFEAMLPRLATYLGHVKVASTYLYLTVLPETLLAASERFRRYGGSLIAAAGESHART
jgi:integrase/recombinase XerD